MKHKLTDVLTCGLFCGFLALMAVLFLVLPKQEFSQKEKRVLAQVPDTSWNGVLTGTFGSQAERYVADHIPGRDFFVGVSNYYDLLSGRQVTKDIYLAAGQRLVERPNVENTAAIQRNMTAINRFAETVGQPVRLMIVPSAGFVLEDSVAGLHGDYTDDAIIERIYAHAGSGVETLDLASLFSDAQDPGALYYRTDHHWTSLGAYTAYSAFMGAVGRGAVEKDLFAVERQPGFYGTTYARSGLWLVPPEEIELWSTGKSFTVTAYQNAQDTEGVTHGELFYRQRLREQDKYAVFLNGNQPLVRIRNPEGEGKLLVIRDSYANCLGTFLANSYAEVVLVDLRYYKSAVSQIVEAEGFDDILVCYSLYNFLTDANFPWLK